MSILIKGMRMPENCYMCPMCHRAFDGNETRLACYALKTWCSEEDGKLDNCPLVEVKTPHGRLFDETEVKKCLQELTDCEDKWSAIALLEWAIEKRWCIEAEDKT